MALGTAINQKNPVMRPGGVNSVNDCWVIAGIMAGRAVAGDYEGPSFVTFGTQKVPTIPRFRAYAGKPDAPGQAGAGDLDAIEKGIKGAYPTVTTYQTRTFDTFLAKARGGQVGALIVNSAKLPVRFQYGFKGIHAITVRMVVTTAGETLYGLNPLQVQGSAPVKLTEKELRAAFMGAVMVAGPAPVPAPVPVPPKPVPAPVPPAPAPSPVITQAAVDAAKEAGINEGIASEKKRLRDLLGL